jgi:hypothetical protein
MEKALVHGVKVHSNQVQVNTHPSQSSRVPVFCFS